MSRSSLRRLVAILVLGCGSALADEAKVTVDYNVRIRMRDGVELSADIYRPQDDGRHPVVVVRTPYTKTPNYDQRGRWWAERGYVFVVQDVRGRGDSDGKFYPLVNEAADGIDTSAWARRQHWSTGKVGTFGGSYSGWTQLYSASRDAHAYDAMIPMSTPPDPDRNFPYQHGVLLPAAAAWLASIDGRLYQRLDKVDLDAAYDTRPLLDMDRRMGRNLPAWRDWVQHDTRDAYWEKQAYQAGLTKSAIPALHMSGWYDDVQVGTTENFANLTAPSRSDAMRRNQFLVIGPWGHALNAGQKLGAIDFGPQAVIDLDGLHLRWFDRWLKGIDNGVEKMPRVRLFVMGSNQWIDENEWPIARTQYRQLFLQSGGKANSLNGDGTLSFDAPEAGAPSDRFSFDPANPIPFSTGLDSKQMGGPDDYRSVEERTDLLVYTAEAATAPTRICGPVRAVLFAASSARDTDWTAKLLDVHPDGYAQRLNDGIVRAQFRNGTAKKLPLTPGKAERYEIDLWSTCIDLLPGHRLRVEIASSAARKFDVNLNTGEPQGTATKGFVAEQTILHDAAHPSHILLPVIADERR